MREGEVETLRGTNGYEEKMIACIIERWMGEKEENGGIMRVGE